MPYAHTVICKPLILPLLLYWIPCNSPEGMTHVGAVLKVVGLSLQQCTWLVLKFYDRYNIYVIEMQHYKVFITLIVHSKYCNLGIITNSIYNWLHVSTCYDDLLVVLFGPFKCLTQIPASKWIANIVFFKFLENVEPSLIWILLMPVYWMVHQCD